MSDAPIDERELLRLMAKGSEAAFGVLYERHQGPVYRFIWHMTGDRAGAEEVTQEVFLRLIRDPGRFRPEKGSLGAFLYGIARNLVLQRWNDNRREVAMVEEPAEGDESSLAVEIDLLGDIDRRERLASLRRAVLALPPLYREAVVLCEIQEMNHAEAAAILGCPPGTLASRIHRARNMLRERLKEMRCVS